MTLYEINAEIERLVENSVDPETGEINEEVFESLEELGLKRDEKIENVGCFIKNLRSDVDALKAEAKKLTERAKYAANKADRLEGYLAECLAGEKFSSPRLSVSYRKSTKVECEDINAVPNEYLKYAAPELDKTAVKKVLAAGAEIPGCSLVESVNIQIK